MRHFLLALGILLCTAFAWAVSSRHVETIGTTPTVSTCGTSPTIVGNDHAGIITIGTGVSVTACTLTFAQGYKGSPACVAVASGASIVFMNSISSSAMTLGFSITLGGGTVQYICADYT